MSSIVPLVCRVCERPCSIDDFYTRANGKRRTDCKACFSARNKARRDFNLDAARAKQRERHHVRKNDHAYIQHRRDYDARNRDKILLGKAKYRATRRDELNAKQRERYRQNPDITTQSSRRWRAANRERKNASERARRMRNWERSSQLTRISKAKRRDHIAGARYRLCDWQALCAWLGGVCLCCHGAEPITVDHVIPLSRGGTNTIGNLQPLCDRCNKSKGARRTTDYRDPAKLALFLASIGH